LSEADVKYLYFNGTLSSGIFYHEEHPFDPSINSGLSAGSRSTSSLRQAPFDKLRVFDRAGKHTKA
jgi:hypothetical protein